MITLFNYYNLKIHFVKKDTQPIHIYANRKEQSSWADVQFNKGRFDKVVVHEREGFPPLDETDINRMKLLIINNLDEIIKRWIDFYIFNREIEEEIITQRIEDAPFS